MSAPTTSAVELRKLRKKLRQIGNLERLDRPLTQDERDKMEKKYDIRHEIQMILHELGPGGNNAMLADEARSQDRGKGKAPPQETMSEDDSPSEDHNPGFPDGGDAGRGEAASNTTRDGTDRQGSGDAGEMTAEKDSDEENVSPSRKKEPSAKTKTAEVIPGNADGKEGTQDTESIAKQTKAGRKRKKSDEKKKEESPLESARKTWMASTFSVLDLDGHCEAVTSAHIKDNRLITTSMDTTVKVWRLDTMTEERNLGGHTSTTTAAVLLSDAACQELSPVFELEDVEQLAISGSLDCSFKVWSVDTGHMLKSVYTFNPVTKLVFWEDKNIVITGSDGGKVELWDLSTSSLITSCHAHEDGVAQLQLSGHLLCSASSVGEIKLFDIKDKTLKCIFVNENVRTHSGTEVTWRHVRSLALTDSLILYGDDGTNIKALSWKKALVQKWANHTQEFGSSDALCLHNDLLLSSSYDIDSGLGSVNVHEMPSGAYLCSLNDEDTERILCLAASNLGGKFALVTGGPQLKVWLLESRMQSQSEPVKPRFVSKLQNPAQDSDEESDEEDEEDSKDGESEEQEDDEGGAQTSGGWLSWCSVV